MKKTFVLLIVGLCVIPLFQQDNRLVTFKPPLPSGEDEGKEHLRREVWFELMHQSATNTDWRQVEYQNQYRRHQNKINNLAPREDCGTISIANGLLQGRWAERGSNNQAGSVFDTEYDPVLREIWIMSAGGTLWRGPQDGSNWQVVNQDLQFNPGILKFIPISQGRRVIAFVGRIPHYSDDNGYSWTPAQGVQYNDRYGDFHSPLILNDSLHTFYFLAKASYWENITLYKSSDLAEHFHAVKTFQTSDFSNLQLCNPHHSNELLLIEKTSPGFAKISRINTQTDAIQLLNQGTELKIGEAPANLIGWSGNALTRLYAYAKNNGAIRLYTSENYGATWATKGLLPAEPWEVGLYVLPSNPDVLLMGEVECYRSLDGGKLWSKVNNWYDYYNNVPNTLHADMMHFAEFTDAEGLPFLLVSHHGGLSFSDDYLDSRHNISLEGLNTSQYYSVRTDPRNPTYAYAGSQDQGFQLADEIDEPGVADFKQLISGDYGHIVFSNGDQSLWLVYPGGDVAYYENAQSGLQTASYELKSENESVWLPPLMSSPYSTENAVYMAGGNINGGKGSRIIRLEAKDGQIVPSQFAFDFKAQSGGGEVSALGSSSLNPDLWYAATTNGRFFYSVNGGQNWTQNLNFIPDGHYLYGQAIYASKVELGTVYLGGSGYSNPAVFKSTNGGVTFTAMSTGLPNTLVFDIAANTDESLLFAATEAGPYVFVKTDGRWYDMSGACAPAQTYWSVEYVESQNLVRFGTYGRGIWDFQLDATVATNEPALAANAINIFPNPSDGNMTVAWPNVDSFALKIWNLQGQLVFQTQVNASSAKLDLTRLTKGAYIIQVQDHRKTASSKLLLR